MAFKVLGSAVIDENENIVSAGSANFAGNVELGATPTSGAAEGVLIRKNGRIELATNQSSTPIFEGYTVGVSSPTSNIKADGSSEFFKTLLKTPTGTTNSTNLLTVSDSSSNVNFTVKGTGATNIFGPLVVDRNAGGDPDTGSVVVQSGGTVKTRLNDDGSATFAGDVTTDGQFRVESSGVERLRVNSSGSCFIGNPSGSGVVNSTNRRVLISGEDGSATFTGTVDAGALTIGGSSVDTSAQVDAKIAALVDGAPTALNTLNELAAALNDQGDYAASITSILATKANSSSLATVATSGSYTDLSNKPTIPTHTSHLTNNSGFITDAFTGTITGNTLHLGGSQISSSNAKLQVNGFQRTGAIAMHQSSAPTAGDGAPETTHKWLTNISGVLRWGTNATTSDGTIWHSGNDGIDSGLNADNLDDHTWGSSGKDIRGTEFYADGWFRSYNYGNGLYNEATQRHFFSANSNYWHINSGRGLIFYDDYNGTGGDAGNRKGFIYHDGGGFGLLGDSGNWAVSIPHGTTSVIIGGHSSNNPYNSVSSTRLLFGGGNDPNNYYIGTNLEDYNGNYTKLDLAWHTGIRMGAQPSYGGVRIYNNEDFNTLLFSVGSGNSNVTVTNTLTVGGDVSASGNVTAYASDRRLKENFKHIESPLEKIQKLNGYTFDWIDGVKELGFEPSSQKDDIGLIAQEVQEVMPQATAPAPFDQEWDTDVEKYVSKSGEDYLTIQYEKLVPLLVEAIKDQQKQIDELNKKLGGN